MTKKLILILRAIRVYQWTKNVLIFVPLVLAHRWFDLDAIGSAVIAFFSLSFGASALYVVNDIADLDSDRQHPEKKSRPFASGALSVRAGYILVPLLLGGSAVLAALLPEKFWSALAGYLLFAWLYSHWLKSVVLIDVMVLAGLYTVRIVAGAGAIDVPVTFWLEAFSIFIFFSLAMTKRYSELLNLKNRGEIEAKGRGYHTGDLQALGMFGVASGFIAILILALYINQPKVTELYTKPQWLWLVCPTFLYWVSHIWLTAQRGEMGEDPLLHAMRDKASYAVAAVSMFAIWRAL
jgi:4-hydroxybenzoate polyprenyltransferase